MKIKTNHFASLRQTSHFLRKNGKSYTLRANRGRFFFPDEWMAFEDKLKPRQKIAFKFLLNTGARINEIRNVRVNDVDFERSVIVLRVTKRVVNRPRQKQGTSNVRVISISSQFTKFLRGVIKDYNLRSDDYFPILSTPAANIAMKKTLQKAGIGDWDMFSVHNVRKTLETWLLALEIDSFKIIKHFGHTSAIALKHYVGSDIFSNADRMQMRMIIGDLYQKST